MFKFNIDLESFVSTYFFFVGSTSTTILIILSVTWSFASNVANVDKRLPWALDPYESLVISCKIDSYALGVLFIMIAYLLAADILMEEKTVSSHKKNLIRLCLLGINLVFISSCYVSLGLELG
jgi:hypothetical protein